VDAEAEWVSGRTGIDGEDLVAVRVVVRSSGSLQLAATELDGKSVGLLEVIDVAGPPKRRAECASRLRIDRLRIDRLRCRGRSWR
jgi:hypothetical protein